MNENLTKKFHSKEKWNPPDHWQKITTIDAHTEGEPLRIILSGYPELPGKSILERRRYARENLDYLRTALMWEPRGHVDMYGCILTPAVTEDADFGVLFLHNEGYSTMCGHGIIAITKVVLETGMLPMNPPETAVKIDTPAGLVTAYARIKNNRVESVYFHNVPSFVYTLEESVEVSGIGKVKYDIAFGGAFYAYVQAKDLGLSCTPEYFRILIEKGTAIKNEIMRTRKIQHPFEEDLNFLYGTIFIDSSEERGHHNRNVCVFADGEVDRCPTGTGVSGRLAIHYARNEIDLNEPITIESIIGSRFTGSAIKSTQFGPYDAIIPEVEGTAFITGQNEFYIDPDDPFKHGFILR